MKFEPLPLEGACRVVPEKRSDERGFFARIFCKQSFEDAGLKGNWVQTNNSLSVHKGTLRGLHLQQPPMAECKLIRCVQGAIWDVIVDLRSGSDTFGQWYGEELNAENRVMMYVPEGFAHGFIALTDQAEIIYPTTQYYSPDHEFALLWSDPAVDIQWPISPTVISEKDQTANTIQQISTVGF